MGSALPPGVEARYLRAVRANAENVVWSFTPILPRATRPSLQLGLDAGRRSPTPSLPERECVPQVALTIPPNPVPTNGTRNPPKSPESRKLGFGPVDAVH